MLKVEVTLSLACFDIRCDLFNLMTFKSHVLQSSLQPLEVVRSVEDFLTKSLIVNKVDIVLAYWLIHQLLDIRLSEHHSLLTLSISIVIRIVVVFSPSN